MFTLSFFFYAPDVVSSTKNTHPSNQERQALIKSGWWNDYTNISNLNEHFVDLNGMI